MMEKNQEEINQGVAKIAEQEQKIVLKQEFLGIAFYVLAIGTLIFIFQTLGLTSDDAEFSMYRDQIIGIRIILSLSFFAVSIIVGYALNKLLEKKLNCLWEQKKALFM